MSQLKPYITEDSSSQMKTKDDLVFNSVVNQKLTTDTYTKCQEILDSSSLRVVAVTTEKSSAVHRR